MQDNGGLDYGQADTLLARHINTSTISEIDRKMLSKEAIWIYHSNKDADRYNYEKMVEMVSSDNPIITVQGRYESALNKSNGVVSKNIFHVKSKNIQRARLCKDAKWHSQETSGLKGVCTTDPWNNKRC